MNPIQPTSFIKYTGNLYNVNMPKKAPSTNNADFAKPLGKMISDVNKLQQKADSAVENVTMGKGGIHQAILAVNKADLSLKLAVEVRNKAVDAYQEVMRMSI